MPTTRSTRGRRSLVVLSLVAGALAIGAPATTSGAANPAHHSDDWSLAQPVAELNSDSPDGCPIEGPDRRTMYIASMRPGTLGGNDIWVSHRRNENEPWSTPENLGPPVNGAANDFCPTPLPGHGFLFVSERPGPETCNAGPMSGDMYFTPLHPVHGAEQPIHLGCVADGTGPNFDGPEFSPSVVHRHGHTWLFFSSTGHDANMDMYVTELLRDGTFTPPEKIVELSSPADDRMPNVSPDGLEIVFSSNRTDLEGEQGEQDVYVSHRDSVFDPWGTPVNLGPDVNTAASETRASLSVDGERLYFGRLGDIFVSTRPTGGHAGG